jgi:hypothetical protein
MKFQAFWGKGEGKMLTSDVERSADRPYSNRQHHNNLISVPDRNANGINKQQISGNCHNEES